MSDDSSAPPSMFPSPPAPLTATATATVTVPPLASSPSVASIAPPPALSSPTAHSLTHSLSLSPTSPSAAHRLSSAKLATSIQAAHHEPIIGLASLHSPRKNRIHRAAAHTSLAIEEKSIPAISTPRAQLIQALSIPSAHSGPHVEVHGHRKGTYHHLPPMTEAEKKILFDALPTLRQMDDQPHSPELRHASLSVVRQWLQDKLSKSKWVALIKSIKIMAEGSEHTNLNAKHHILQSMGLDARSLHTAGIPGALQCLALGTRVATYDGRIGCKSIAVEDIRRSTPLIGHTGELVYPKYDAMVEATDRQEQFIFDTDAGSYTVSADHRITVVINKNPILSCTRVPHAAGAAFDLSVRWLHQPCDGELTCHQHVWTCCGLTDGDTPAQCGSIEEELPDVDLVDIEDTLHPYQVEPRDASHYDYAAALTRARTYDECKSAARTFAFSLRKGGLALASGDMVEVTAKWMVDNQHQQWMRDNDTGGLIITGKQLSLRNDDLAAVQPLFRVAPPRSAIPSLPLLVPSPCLFHLPVARAIALVGPTRVHHQPAQLATGVDHAGRTTYTPLQTHHPLRVCYMMHTPIKSTGFVGDNLADCRSAAFSSIDAAHRLIGLDVTAESGLLLAHINPIQNPTGDINSLQPMYDSICAGSIGSVLESGVSVVVSFGRFVCRRWRAVDSHTQSGVTKVESRIEHQLATRIITYKGRDIKVIFAPQPSEKTYDRKMMRAIATVWCATADQLAVLDDRITHMAHSEYRPFRRIERVACPTRFVQVEIDAACECDKRFLLADGQVTHNSRLYRALWVYSLGIHELVTEIAHHAKNNHIIIGNIFKVYAILLEDYQGEDYVMALLQVEAESQRVLKLMEERFSKSLQLKAENEVKTQTEVKTLSALLERSQLEARTLLEKKESLLHEILHLETLNGDLETMNSEQKKELWFTSNALNRVTGKYEQLIKSSKLNEEKLFQDIHDLKVDHEEVKSSLDLELATNERLSYKVDRFTSTISDLTANVSRLKTELNERMHEANLVNKVLEKTTLDLSNVERDKLEQEVEFQIQLNDALERTKELEARIRMMEDSDRARLAREVAAAASVSAAADAAASAGTSAGMIGDPAGDPTDLAATILQLREEIATSRLIHAKELSELTARNGVMTDRIRALQKKVRNLGGGNRFRHRVRQSESNNDELEESEVVHSPPMSPRKQLPSASDAVRGVSTRARCDSDANPNDDSGDSTGDSKNGSRRGSRTKPKVRTGSGSMEDISMSKGGRSPNTRSRSLSGSGTMQMGNANNDKPNKSLAIELAQLQCELDSKEKLNTNLLVSINKLKVTLSQQSDESKKRDESLTQVKAELAATKDMLFNETQLRSSMQRKCADHSSELDRLGKFEKLSGSQSKQIEELQKQKIHYLTDNTDLNARIMERTKEVKAIAKELKQHKSLIAKLKDDVKDLHDDNANRAKNQNELGLRIRTLNMENQSLQSLNDEIQRNLKSTADNSSLLGSLETKNNEINRLFLKIREMEHARIELIKAHDMKLIDTKHKAEAEAQKKSEEAITVEVARAKKLRNQITEQKANYTHMIDGLRAENQQQMRDLTDARAAADTLSKENARLQQSLDQYLPPNRRSADKDVLTTLSITAARAHHRIEPNNAHATASTIASATSAPSTNATSSLAPSNAPSPIITNMAAPQTGPNAPEAIDLSAPFRSATLAELGIEDLSPLLSGSTPVTAHSLAGALKELAAEVSHSHTLIRDGKEARDQLEEANFMYKNQILVLQEQIDSIKTKYREVVVRLHATGDGDNAIATGGSSRKRKKEKKFVGAATLTPDEPGEPSSSSDDDTRKAPSAVRFTRDTMRTSVKRDSNGKSEVPPLTRSTSKMKLMADKADEAANTATVTRRSGTLNSKSPRGTLTRLISANATPNQTSPHLPRRSITSDDGLEPLSAAVTIGLAVPCLPGGGLDPDDTAAVDRDTNTGIGTVPTRRTSQKIRSPAAATPARRITTNNAHGGGHRGDAQTNATSELTKRRTSEINAQQQQMNETSTLTATSGIDQPTNTPMTPTNIHRRSDPPHSPDSASVADSIGACRSVDSFDVADDGSTSVSLASTPTVVSGAVTVIGSMSSSHAVGATATGVAVGVAPQPAHGEYRAERMNARDRPHLLHPTAAHTHGHAHAHAPPNSNSKSTRARDAAGVSASAPAGATPQLSHQRDKTNATNANATKRETKQPTNATLTLHKPNNAATTTQ